ncbi:MAG: outer membrane lipoprotein Blc [Methanomassiliicoccales archaeon PtaU1.Bin124]|nr:MAG: outer membrane lipoprotein Blc [Methanomassiliicoccales archaeon PtaU1.Bin124]
MTVLETVTSVDISRYLGKWYEIAKFPVSFENGLVGITAEYSLLPNGKVRVVNSGHVGSIDGKLKVAKGKAWVVDRTTNAKLKVRFFWPFAADYWIIELGADYEYAVVSGPMKNYLWILSRRPVMDESLYQEILERLLEKGFDVSRLEKNLQSSAK